MDVRSREMARNLIGEMVAKERQRRRWGFGDLARRLLGETPSQRQISKMSMRLVALEREARWSVELLERVMAILQLDPVVVSQMMERQRREELAEWEAWIAEPIEPQLICKIMPGIWLSRPLPETITTEEQAIEYAREFSKKAATVVLQWERRASHWFSAGEYQGRREARPDRMGTPFMTVGGQPFLLRSG
jgi:hypothetical protein